MKTLLSISASQVLFHFTGIKAATTMLVGKAQLTPTVIGSDQLVKSQYFMSLTRSRMGRYHASSTQGVLFELDGRKLSQRFKITPVNYWGANSTPRLRHDSNEMEERLLSDAPDLDMTPYITRICVLAKPMSLDPYAVRIFKMYSRKLGVPVEFYSEPKYFQTSNRSRTVDASVLVRQPQEPKKSWPRAERRADEIFGSALRLLRATRNRAFNMYRDIDTLGLNRRFRGFVTSYQRDLKPQLEAAFHNAARDHGKDRAALDRLLAEMRLIRISSPNQLAIYFINRYEADWKAQRSAPVDDGW